MSKFRRLDRDPGWITRELRELKRTQQQQAAAKRLPGSAVPEGGNFFVRGLLSIVGTLKLIGDLSFSSEDGNEILRIGAISYGRGMELKRDDGSQALRFRKPFSPTQQQILELCDRTGTVVVREHDLGAGLGKPHLNIVFQPAAATTGAATSTLTYGPYGWERTTSATSWETLFVADTRVQNRFIDFKFAALCSDGATAGEVQIVNLTTSTALPGYLSAAPWVGAIVAGTTTLTVLDPTPDQVEAPIYLGAGAAMRLGVQVRRTAGSGSITLAIAQSVGA